LNAIEVKGLTKAYGNIMAADRLDLTIGSGVIFGLLGPNGCGKTTAIKMLLGLVRPDSGSAKVLGHRPGDRGSLSDVGYMPQETAMYEELSVRENLKLFAGIHDLSGKEYLQRESEVLGLVNLLERKDAILSTLSGGQRHRVSLAASMIHTPKLLFLDEPTVGVDPPLRANFWKTFRGMRDRGITIIMTTHYMDEAVNCDLIAMMRDGRIIAKGTPTEIMSRTSVKSLEEAFLKLSSGEVTA
jgi:ABC-2 type transport system ATP-binding protein